MGVGVVTGEAAPFHDTWLAGLDLDGRYEHAAEADDPDAEEGNQNSACRMRSRFTVETLLDRFDLGPTDE